MELRSLVRRTAYVGAGVAAVTVGLLAIVQVAGRLDAARAPSATGSLSLLGAIAPLAGGTPPPGPSPTPGGMFSIATARALYMGIGGSPGELQSTVVAPDLNSSCPKGRLLISNDKILNPGRIKGIELDGTYRITNARFTDFCQLAEPGYWCRDATPTYIPWGEHGSIGSNDHDLVTLNNGDVVYIRMGRIKTMLLPKPAWFDVAWKNGAWGPGARSALFVWKSTDCGEHFDYVNTIDTGGVDDEWGVYNDYSGGMPQLPANTTPPLHSEAEPVYQMGGTDGPLARADPATGRLFVTYNVVGGIPASVSPYTPMRAHVNRTIVMMSPDGGVHWQRLGAWPVAEWRGDIVPLSGNRLAFAEDSDAGGSKHSDIYLATIGAFPPAGSPQSPVAIFSSQGWSKRPKEHLLLDPGPDEDPNPAFRMGVNLADPTLLMRSPNGINLFLLGPYKWFNGDGYMMYRYDPVSGTKSERLGIGPKVGHPDNLIVHPVVIAPGINGPIMVYWYDIDTAAMSFTVWGRLYTSDEGGVSRDFKVARVRDVGYSSDLSTAPVGQWYGDYMTAGGYVRNVPSAGTYYHYFPIWMEPDGKVHYTEVVAKLPLPFITPD